MNALESQETSHHFSSSGSSLGPTVITQGGGPHSPRPLPGLCQALRAHSIQEDGERPVITPFGHCTCSWPKPTWPPKGLEGPTAPHQAGLPPSWEARCLALATSQLPPPIQGPGHCAPLSLENPQSREAVTLPGTKPLPNSNPSWPSASPPLPPLASSGLGTSASKQNLVLKQNVSLRNQKHGMQPRAAFSERG